MESSSKQIRLSVSGMVCQSCSARIDKRLSALSGVRYAKADYRANTLDLSYDPQRISLQDIGNKLDELGYELNGEAAGACPAKRRELPRLLGLLVILLGGYVVLEHYGLLGFLNVFPEAEAGMSYGMILTVGLLTSAHCVAMCGGITLSQSISHSPERRTVPQQAPLLPTLLYGLGRVVSYTLIGAFAGGLGSMISFSGGAKGIVQIAAGVFMMLMGLNLTGMFPSVRRLIPHLPNLFGKSSTSPSRRGPLMVGLLNGLMPCGPLQTMQLFALSTGSPLQGALAMFFFALGTLPLTTGLGLVAAYLGRRFMNGTIRVGAILVFIMGAAMLVNGLRLSGFAAPGLLSGGTVITAQRMDTMQVLETALAPDAYQAVRLQAGIPVRWNIHADHGTINGCNNRIFIPAFGIEKKLAPGDNIIEFTPMAAGIFPYSCWMGMIASRIVVGDVEDTGLTPELDASQLPDMSNDPGNDIPWL